MKRAKDKKAGFENSFFRRPISLELVIESEKIDLFSIRIKEHQMRT
jgi:hypothetical protein